MNKRTRTDTIVIHCTQTPADMDIDVPLTCTACAPVTSSSLPTCNVPSRLIK